MAVQNPFQINSTTSSVNQGAYGTPMHMKKIVAGIVTPDAYQLTAAEVATLKTTLQADVINSDPSQRIQVIGVISGTRFTGDAPVTKTTGYGLKSTIYSGQYSYNFEFADSDLIKQQIRQKLNGNAARIFLVDSDGTIFGTNGDDGTGVTVWQGFSIAEYFANNIVMDDGKGVFQSLDISFSDPAEFNFGNLHGEKAGFNVNSNLKNVADAYLLQKSALVTRVVSVAPFDQQWGSTNLAKVYATVLGGGSAPALWVVTDHATGTALTVSSAVKTVIGGVDAITLTMSATSFPTSGGSIDISLAAPSVLAAAGVKFYESNVLNITV